MTTYVREGLKHKWHVARPQGRAVLPGEYVGVLCSSFPAKAREITNDRQETGRAGICYRCGAKSQ